MPGGRARGRAASGAGSLGLTGWKARSLRWRGGVLMGLGGFAGVAGGFVVVKVNERMYPNMC